ncbi:MAG: CvpA family protein [Candidatus Izemoplasmatales bacterium]|nr:CvpA family protein [Candidatus Izemoplasmatales bacterium]
MNVLNLFGLLDVLIILLIIGLTILGWKSGFLLKVIKLASSLFGLIASLLLAKPFSGVLDKWFGADIYLKVEAYLIEHLNAGATTDATEEGIRQAFEGLAMPKFVIDWIVESVNTQETMQSIVDAISPMLTSLILLIIAFISLFFGSMLIFLLLKMLAKMVTSIPVIKQVDKVLGAIFGLFKALVLIYVLLFVLGLIISVPAINDFMGEFLMVDMQLETDKFRISKWFYDNNVLKYIVYVFAIIL